MMIFVNFSSYSSIRFIHIFILQVLQFDPQGEEAKAVNLAELVEGITKIDHRTIITENDVISDEHIDRLLDRSDLIEKMNADQKKEAEEFKKKLWEFRYRCGFLL